MEIIRIASPMLFLNIPFKNHVQIKRFLKLWSATIMLAVKKYFSKSQEHICFEVVWTLFVYFQRDYDDGVPEVETGGGDVQRESKRA